MHMAYIVILLILAVMFSIFYYRSRQSARRKRGYSSEYDDYHTLRAWEVGFILDFMDILRLKVFRRNKLMEKSFDIDTYIEDVKTIMTEDEYFSSKRDDIERKYKQIYGHDVVEVALDDDIEELDEEMESTLKEADLGVVPEEDGDTESGGIFLLRDQVRFINDILERCQQEPWSKDKSVAGHLESLSKAAQGVLRGEYPKEYLDYMIEKDAQLFSPDHVTDDGDEHEEIEELDDEIWEERIK